MTPRLALAVEAAYRAGRSTLAHFQNGVAVETKADDTPVTIADREAEAIARAVIAAKDSVPIVGEEEGGDLAAGTRWIIDPIDGTKSFVAGVPLYATLVSFEESFLPVAAACYFPALDEMLYADLEGGAFFNGRPCRVSSRTDLDRALVCVGNPQRFVSLGRLEGFLRLSAGVLDVRTWCDAYGHALVATGRVDAMIDPNISLWDVSALSLILKEAGGTFTDFDGRDTLVHPRENGKYDAISANGKLTQEVLGLFHP